MCWSLFGPHFRPFVVICRDFFHFFLVHVLSLFFEGSLPARWRPWPQLGLILSHPKTQKVSSRVGQTQVVDLAAFSTAHSSWLLLSSSWDSSWPAFGNQNWPQIRPRSRPRSVSKMEPKKDKKSAPKWCPKTEVKIENVWQKWATGATF